MRLAFLAAIALGVSTASADEVTTDDFEATTARSMATLCTADTQTNIGKYARGFCYGWIEGVEQFYTELLRDRRFDARQISCPGRAVSREETRQIFVSWVDANPDLGLIEPLDAVIRASKEKFPCE